MNTWSRRAALLHQCIAIAGIVISLTDCVAAQQTPARHPLDESLLDATTREWLAAYRRLGTGTTPEARRWRDNETEFKTVLHACVSKPPESKAVTIVGRIGVAGTKPIDPRGIASPCAILEGGFFATRVEDGVLTLPFRHLGFEPLDFPVKPGAQGVVNVGQITLKPLPRKSAVTAVGRIELEDDPVLSGRPKVQVAWNIMAERLTKEEELQESRVLDFEHERESQSSLVLMTQVGRDGKFRTAGLVPAFYQVVVSAPGYITTAYYVDLSDKAGQTSELHPMPLLVAKSFTNSVGMEFVRIPPGEFPAKPYYLGENALSLLTVPTEFYITRHEFSRGQYETLTGSLGKDFGTSHENETKDHPLRLLKLEGKGALDLEPAFRICRLLTDFPAEKSAGRTYRLPDEKEWVHACRAGTRTRFPILPKALAEYLWNEASSRTLSRPPGMGEPPRYTGRSNFEAMGMPGNMFETSIGSLRPHGKGIPNPWGLYDMQGNVREVCIRWLEPQEVSHWSPSSKIETTDVGSGWQIQVQSWSGRDFLSSVFSTQAGEVKGVGEIRVRGGGYMSDDLECLRGRSLRAMDYGVGLRVVCTIAE